MAKEILCAYGVDIDAVAGWIGSYGGGDSPDDISRGLFAGEVGTPRMLNLFERNGIKATWFIPGHSIETFPKQVEEIVAAGHEIGMHGYTHENPIAMTAEQEEAVMRKCVALIEQVSGRRPTGYVAPWWEFSTITNELLLKLGIKYDHSLMHNDFTPYYVRVGDTWTLIDYAKQAEEWMVPLQRGHDTDLVEIPASWHLDDLPPMMFIKKSPNSHGFVNPRDIEQIWMDQFDWVHREMDYAVFTMTVHPDVSGRPGVLMMHERIIEHINRHDGVRWCTLTRSPTTSSGARRAGIDRLVDDLGRQGGVGRIRASRRRVREAVDARDEHHRARHPRGHALRVVSRARRHLAKRLAALARTRAECGDDVRRPWAARAAPGAGSHSTSTPRAAPRSRAKATIRLHSSPRRSETDRRSSDRRTPPARR